MVHRQMTNYIKLIKEKYPHHFKNKKVLECGSLDIHGNNRIYFQDCDYLGIDLGEGKNSRRDM